MGLPKQLSEQQKKFAELLVYNEGRKTPTECAIEAGYAEGCAHVRASELLDQRTIRRFSKFPYSLPNIGRRTSYRSIKNMRCINFLKKLVLHSQNLAGLRGASLICKGCISAAANALIEVARGKAAGLYIEQKISLTGKIEDSIYRRIRKQNEKDIRRQQSINRRRVYSWQRRVSCIVNTYLDQRREHLLDRV